jgi:oxygen-independent coproporphyrinogen-3 oxidase
MNPSELISSPRDQMYAPGFGLYIHVPFCVSKCAYCAFSSIAGAARMMQPYIDTVLREIDDRAFLGSGRSVDSLYLGGGTPSLLPPTEITRLLGHCREAFRFAAEAEVTLEANPETVTPERVSAWLDAGVTRVSMGVQSLDDRELVQLDRAHSARRAESAFRTIRAAGCRNAGVDLLYGLPGQPVDRWRETVQRALDLGAEHLSAYALIPEPGTPIGSAVSEGALALPSDDLILAQEEVLHDAVSRSGLERYEISNYAKPGFACRHNLSYWRCDDWLGFGASAHSHIQGQRWWNHFEPGDYIRGVTSGDAVEGRECLNRHQRLGETLAFGLRMVRGVPRQLVVDRFGRDVWTAKEAALRQLVDFGLLEDTREIIRLTSRGLALADSAAALLI